MENLGSAAKAGGVEMLVFVLVIVAAAGLGVLLRGAIGRVLRSAKRPLLELYLRLVAPFVLLAAAFVLRLGPVRDALFTSGRLDPWLNAGLIFFAAFFVLRLVDIFFRRRFVRQGRPVPLPSVLHSFILAVVYLALFFLVLRGILGINITPFLATSALLTAILGLAFQGVLSNVIAGISLHFTKSFGKGDWVGITGHEGVVVDTNWRETRIFDRRFNIVVIPNNVMANETITNFSLPDKKTALILPLKVGFRVPPDVVFGALRAAAAESPKVLSSPAPEVQIHGSDDFGVTYAIKFWITDFAQKNPIITDVLQKVWHKFRRAGVEIPVSFGENLDYVLRSVVARESEAFESDVRERNFIDLKSSMFLRYTEGKKAGEPIANDEEIRRLAGLVRRVRFAPGEVVFRQGDSGETCYVVAGGAIKGQIAYEEKGKPYTMDFRVEPGGLFGEMSLFTGQPRTATGVAEEGTELLEVRREDFACLLEGNPKLAETVADLVSQRNLKNLDFSKKIKELSAQDIAAGTDKKSILKRLKSFILGGRR